MDYDDDDDYEPLDHFGVFGGEEEDDYEPFDHFGVYGGGEGDDGEEFEGDIGEIQLQQLFEKGKDSKRTPTNNKGNASMKVILINHN